MVCGVGCGVFVVSLWYVMSVVVCESASVVVWCALERATLHYR